MSTQIKTNFNNTPTGQSRFLGNMRIGTKIIAGYLLLVVLMAVIAGVAYWGIVRIQTADQQALLRQTEITAFWTMLVYANDQYISQANLIINNDEAFIDEFKAKADAMDKAKVIAEAAADTPDEIGWKNEIERLDAEFDNVFNNQLVSAWRAGDKEKVIALDAQSDELLSGMNKNVNLIIGSISKEIETAQADVAATQQLVIWLMSGVAVASALLGMGFGWFLSRSISGPVQAVAYAAGRLAEGDLTEKIAISGGDEVGMMAEAFSQMSANLRQLIGQVQQSADQVASASQQLNASSTQAGQAANQVANTIQQIANGTGQQSQAVTEATGNVEQTARAAEGIAQGSQDQARSVQKTSALVGDMAGIVEQVGQVAASVTSANGKVTQSARHGVSSVEQTGQGMNTIRERTTEAAAKVKDLGARSKEIGRIIETIDNIADKTDMLALNAAVEAARAGEHGRGFAVVADQVRKLSEDSKNSTRDITDLIERVQETITETVAAIQAAAGEVNTGTRLAGDTSQALLAILQAAEEANGLAGQIDQSVKQLKQKSEGVVTAIESVSAVVEENTAAAEEMAANSQEVTSAMENIAGIAEENSASTEEVSASAEEMSAQIEEVVASAEELSALAEELRNAAAQFKL